MEEHALDEVRKALEEDAAHRNHRYPEQARVVLRDPRVVEVLSRHVSTGARILNIRALPYQATLGLIPVAFDMDPGPTVMLRRPSVLVLVDGLGKVAAIIDGYDPDNPNPNYVSSRAEQPFVLVEESAAEGMAFTEEDLSPGWDRTRSYMRRNVPSSRPTAGTRNGSADSLCSESTIRQTALSAVPTVSGGLFHKIVDDHRTLTQPDDIADSVVDDVIIIEQPL